MIQDSPADRILFDQENDDQPPNDVPPPMWIRLASTIDDIPREELERIVCQYGRETTLARYSWDRSHAQSSGEFDLWSDIIAVVTQMDDAAPAGLTGQDMLHDVYEMEGELDRIRARQQDLLDAAENWARVHDGALHSKLQSLRGMLLLLDVSHQAFEGSLEALLRDRGEGWPSVSISPYSS